MRARKNGKLYGLGICAYVQMASAGPYESAEVRVDGAGKVTVVSGAAPQGQGTGTALAQVVADQLGVEIDRLMSSLATPAAFPLASELSPAEMP